MLERLVEVYTAAADPGRATQMRAYMRDQFPFLGLSSPVRRALDRDLRAGRPKPDEAQLTALALACWELDEREYQYHACDQLKRYAGGLTPGFLPTARHLIVTKSWWDTVDTLAADAVGEIVLRHPAAAATMDDWADSGELWPIRTAIIHQLRFKDRTDTERLFGYCRRHAEHRDFFVRKGIGWALRQYARTDPDAVRAFVAATPQLSGLSVREAMKHLG